VILPTCSLSDGEDVSFNPGPRPALRPVARCGTNVAPAARGTRPQAAPLTRQLRHRGIRPPRGVGLRKVARGRHLPAGRVDCACRPGIGSGGKLSGDVSLAKQVRPGHERTDGALDEGKHLVLRPASCSPFSGGS